MSIAKLANVNSEMKKMQTLATTTAKVWTIHKKKTFYDNINNTWSWLKLKQRDLGIFSLYTQTEMHKDVDITHLKQG